MNKRDLKYFKLAEENANLSDFVRVNLGCVAVYKGKVITMGHNSEKTHPIQMHYNQEFRNLNNEIWEKHSLHAEMMCLNKLENVIDFSEFNKVKLYIYRKTKSRPFGMSRPCPACMQRIKDLGIKNIFYTTNDGFVHEIISR